MRYSEDAEADGGISPISSPLSDVTLYKLIEREKFGAALVYYKANKDDLMKENADLYDWGNDVHTILNLYCKQITQEKPGNMPM